MEMDATQTRGHLRDKWAARDVEALRDMRGEGMSAREIAETGRLPHSLNAIQKKLGRMGLVAKLKITKFNSRQRDEFRDFLRKNWEGKTPQDLADLWNSRPTRPRTNKSRVISYLYDLGIKIHYGEVQSINSLRRKEQTIRTAARSAKELDDMLRKARAEFMSRRIRIGRDIWTGMPLDQDELATEMAP